MEHYLALSVRSCNAQCRQSAGVIGLVRMETDDLHRKRPIFRLVRQRWA
jgi:hypothetical protein